MAFYRTETLGQLQRHRFLIRVTCEPCRRRTYVQPMEMIIRYGMEKHWRSLRFRCAVCGDGGVDVLPVLSG